MIKYAEMEKEIQTRIGGLKENYQRAYEYYAELLKKDYPIHKEKGKEKYAYTNYTYELEESDYLFYEFEMWDIGAPVALKEEDYITVQGKHINYCKFQNCNIKNIIFKHCSFSGSMFKNVKFERVAFEDCMFTVPVMEKGYHEVEDTYYVPAIFERCIFVGRFTNCDLEYALFEKCNFTLTKFENSSMRHVVFNTCATSSLEIKDCNLCEFGIYNTDILDISFTDERLTTVDENTLIDYKIKAQRKNSDLRSDSGWKANDYDDMCLKKAKTIRSISRLFAENELSHYAGEYFYQSKRIEFKGLHVVDKVKSFLALILCGYGERPSFTFITMVFTTLLFGILYMFTGIDAAGDGIRYTLGGNTAVLEVISDYGKCLFFSVTTFSTVGYGNYVPVGSLSMMLSAVHMVIGVSLCALWTGCIFRKIAR